MPTVVLDAYSKAYPSITNRIRASVFLESDPFSLIATIIDTTVGHPARIWHFPGLPRANYGFSLDEIDGGGNPINNLALFSVVPSQIDGVLARDDEQIKVGTTPGFDTGATNAVFDGSGGAPNYIGWEIVPSELTGRGILVEGVDYSWDKITGQFALLQPGDILALNQWYNIHFNPGTTNVGGSEPTIMDFTTRIIVEDATLLVADFGHNVIIEPAGNYIEITLPDITTVPQGRPVSVETIAALGTNVQCVKFLTTGADVINFLRGNLFMMNGESLQIYRIQREDLSNEWRVRNAVGNFATVGEMVGEDSIQSGVFCKHLTDGSSRNRYQYARIYEEIVLTLPATQVVDYDDWNTGNNKYLFSLANSADPGNADKFHFPDRRDLYERNNNADKAGDYQGDMMKVFWQEGMSMPAIVDVNGTNTEIGVDPGAGSPDIKDQYPIDTNMFGAEVRPVTYLINKYYRV